MGQDTGAEMPLLFFSHALTTFAGQSLEKVGCV